MYKLMIVDDETPVRETIRTLLPWTKLGIQIVGSCGSGPDALARMVNDRPDILMTDIKMPVMDGLELIARAKEMYPTLQCLIMSGYGEFDLLKGAIQQGCCDYLLKPCTKQQLMAALERCIAAVKRTETGSIYRFEQRKKAVARIAAELLDVQPEGGQFHAAQVEALIRRYGDYSLLSEAALQLATRYESIMLMPKQMMRRLNDFYNSPEELVKQTAVLLAEIDAGLEANGSGVDQVVRYVADHYATPSLTLQFVADQVVHMNVQYLGKKFVQKMNMKFSDYLLKVRMEHAMALLRSPAAPKMYEIAEQVGFGNNVQYFFTMFKRYAGVTPKDYQENPAVIV